MGATLVHMANVYRTTALWTGFQGAPGYTKFSWQDLTDDTSRNAAGAAMKAFFEGIKAYLLSGTNVTVQGTVESFDLTTGELTGSDVMTTPPTATTGTGIGTYVGGSGFCIQWHTGVIFAGRRVRGATYIVPGCDCYDGDGTIKAATITTAQAAATTLCSAVSDKFSIWARQYSKTPPFAPINATLASASSGTVKDMASQMRSRRL